MGWGIGSIGSILNDITGVTSGARQSQKYALQSAQINNAYQKEFAQNAHQWEMQDLRNAGLNPVLSAGGSGTGASGGGVNSAVNAGSGIDPISTGIGAWQGMENAINTGADTNRKNAEINNVNQDTILKRWQTITEMEKGPLTKAQREKLEAEKNQILKMTPKLIEKIKAETQETYTREEKEFEESLKTRAGLIGTIFGSSPLTRKKARESRALRNR